VLRCLFACLLFLLSETVAGEVVDDDAFLGGLQGKWDMAGTVLGKPARYAAEGERVLQRAFVRVHMIDKSVPPKYEADLYIGFDPKAHDYVAHWLDKFGAAGARVVATGQRHGDQIVLQFPYAQAAFRNTWTRQAQGDAWTLLIEAQEPDGHWSTFADYRLTRSP
jgi:hypothetical protein